MAFQPPQKQYPETAKLHHWDLTKNGPRLVVIKSAPRWVKNHTLLLIELLVDNVPHVYFTKKEEVASKFKDNLGKSVVLVASGNAKQGTDSIEIHQAGVPASSLPNAPQPAVIVESKPAAFKTVTTTHAPQNVPQGVITAPVHRDKEAKQFLCQAANLMRLCVKKANDISVELGLPDQHRQGIATTMFIQADRQGFIQAMPITAYTPEQLGFGASKAESLKNPQPND
jgi:hypothetical protein